MLVFPDSDCLISHRCAEIAVVSLRELMDIRAIAVDYSKAPLCLAAGVSFGAECTSEP